MTPTQDIQRLIDQLRDFTGQQYAFYLTELYRDEDMLFDLKEQTIDPIRRFMSSTHKDIYDEAYRFLQEQEPNFSYIEGDDDQRLREILDDPECYRGNGMQQARTLIERLRAQRPGLEVNSAY